MATVLQQTQPGSFYSSALRQKIDTLMDVLYSGGVNNPMDSIEQLSYLLFLRLLSENDHLLSALDKKHTPLFAGKWSRFSWGNFVTLIGDELFNAVREAIESLHDLPGLSETGRLLFNRATLKIYDRPTLRAVVQGVDSLDLQAHDGHDVKGDMYEYLLNRLATSGTNGQFRTPRHIIDLIISLVNPQKGQRIADPAVGTAGFPIAAFRHILRQNTSRESLERGEAVGDLLKPADWRFLEEQAFTGFDNDANMVKIAILNLYLHNLESAHISIHNPLTTNIFGSYPGRQFDILLANPPFAGKIQKDSILTDINLDTRDTELLFTKWFIDHLAPGGTAGVIVPSGVLFGSSKAAIRARRLLLTECNLQAVISLPSGVFKPYSGVATAILIFKKEQPGDQVWFYDVTSDGYTLDDRRLPTRVNDFPDLLAKWPERRTGGNAHLVSRDQILETKDATLSSNRYRLLDAEEIVHRNPLHIIQDIRQLESAIMDNITALEQHLH